MPIKRDTIHKSFRSPIDLIYQILKLCQNEITEYNIYIYLSMNHNTFKNMFAICIDKNLIIKIQKLKKVKKITYYKITDIGLEYIINYDKMVMHIEKINILLQ